MSTSTKDIQACYQQQFDALLSQPVFGLDRAAKQRLLLPLLATLTELHQQRCAGFANILGSFSNESASTIDTLPFLAVRLFKLMELKSVANEDVFRLLQSSGTTGQTPARVTLDKATSQRQSKVLVAILQQVLGKQRLPMLIIDAPATVGRDAAFSARAAGIQGLAFFGRHHTYALNDDMTPNWSAISQFCAEHGSGPVLVFGFTFMVWQYWLDALAQKNQTLNLPHGVLLHSGGWKKLEHLKVDNTAFKRTIKDFTGITAVHNFYGMAEQVGSIFMECSHGYLHAPSFADVVARDPNTLRVTGFEQQGLLQVLSAVPTSYPGHSLLTEDLGVLHGEDDCACGWKGKYFSVSGRLPKVEVRGCSDTHE
ncbi:acyl-protein synthetase [Alteromonas sp. ASW11-36]|uniref:Acyl-protein synthetase n=1 Tax=Alteromonas arenosi TaxID=3055817 RepID=A0ABT7SX63_9ALTE|nr:acyl-protein synthetase [Alteromonas sp. ASW11-36]MDM7860144.1 acyl-protein synthetase [Alteromonas sp. ASW11-36]